MPATHHLVTPLSKDDIRKLRIGDLAFISGTIYAARDAAHKRMIEALDRGESLPFDPAGQIIYYVGPTPAKPGRPIGSAGPTTSGRMDAYAPRLMKLGLAGMIGKGNRSRAVMDAIRDNVCVYFAATGGAAPLLRCARLAGTRPGSPGRHDRGKLSRHRGGGLLGRRSVRRRKKALPEHLIRAET